MANTRYSVNTPRDLVTLNIANGATESEELNVGGLCLTDLSIPDTWTSCDLTFSVAFADGTLGTLRDKAGVYKPLSVAAGDRLSLEPSVFAGWTRIVIVCSIAQAAARDVVAVLRAVS